VAHTRQGSWPPLIRSVIKNVPVGVCKKCGTKYYTANVLKTIESSVCGRRKAESKIPMAVYSL